jgi:hypothetical protein
MAGSSRVTHPVPLLLGEPRFGGFAAPLLRFYGASVVGCCCTFRLTTVTAALAVTGVADAAALTLAGAR